MGKTGTWRNYKLNHTQLTVARKCVLVLYSLFLSLHTCLLNTYIAIACYSPHNTCIYNMWLKPSLTPGIIGASVSESHLGSSTRPLSVCLSIIIYISYVRNFWSRGPRATRKRKPAHLKFKGHMHACCIYVANASRAITTLIERLHMYSSSLITSSAG